MHTWLTGTLVDLYLAKGAVKARLTQTVKPVCSIHTRAIVCTRPVGTEVNINLKNTNGMVIHQKCSQFNLGVVNF